MNEITIRKATVSDIEQLSIFEQDLIETERPFDPTLKRQNTHYYDLNEMVSAPHIRLLVAQSGDIIVGSGYARLEKSKPYLQHLTHAYLGFMYVLPEHRGKGINQKIMEELKLWVRSQNITELRLEVYQDNASAIKAYEKIGFAKHILQMRLNLDDT